MKAYILVGFTEGKWHIKRFENGLRRHGFSLTTDMTEADCVITHSAGCYVIPPLAEHQILMLINPTHWPGRSLGRSAVVMIQQMLLSVRPGNYFWHHLRKSLHNVFYLVYRWGANWQIVRQAPVFSLEQSINHPRTILVRNQADPWLTPNLDVIQQQHPKLTIVRLPGDHDDCWLHPRPYIELLENYR
jgi:hypothetical protein